MVAVNSVANDAHSARAAAAIAEIADAMNTSAFTPYRIGANADRHAEYKRQEQNGGKTGRHENSDRRIQE